MTIQLLTAFSIYAFVTAITPGPNNIMLLASGLNFGFSRSISHITGVAGGFAIMVAVVGLGLGVFFETYPVTYTVMQAAGSVYLLYLAWNIAHAGPMSMQGKEGAQGKPMGFFAAAAFQWVNPKAWIMAVGASSIYAPHEHYFMNVLIIAFVYGLIGVPSSAAWVCFGAWFKRYLADARHMTVFNIVMALLLAASVCPTIYSFFKKVTG